MLEYIKLAKKLYDIPLPEETKLFIDNLFNSVKIDYESMVDKGLRHNTILDFIAPKNTFMNQIEKYANTNINQQLINAVKPIIIETFEEVEYYVSYNDLFNYDTYSFNHYYYIAEVWETLVSEHGIDKAKDVFMYWRFLYDRIYLIIFKQFRTIIHQQYLAENPEEETDDSIDDSPDDEEIYFDILKW